MTTWTHRNGAAIAAGREGGGLLWTEYWYLLGAVVAAVVVVDPLEMALAAEPLLKHLALLVSLPAVALTLLGSRMSAPRRPGGTESPAAVLWPLILLAALIVAGSLHARLVQGIQNTFLNVGLYMLAAYGAAAMVTRSGAPEALVRGYFRILLAAAAVMAAWLVANYGVRQVYHEQIFLVIPMAVLFFAQPRGTLLRWTGCAFFLAMAWVSQKYTSYLIGALAFAYIAFALALPRAGVRPGLQRVMMIYWTLLAAAAIAGGFAWLGMTGSMDLPTGNVDYRMHTYLNALDRFTESPLWGNFFAVEAVEKFTLYSVGVASNMLATHSDVLDLLANGGLLAVALWLLALARIARVVLANLLRPQRQDDPRVPYAHALIVMSAAGVVTYVFNPILLQPAMAYLLWTNLGLLVGLALSAATEVPMAGWAPRWSEPGPGYRGAAPNGLNARVRP